MSPLKQVVLVIDARCEIQGRHRQIHLRLRNVLFLAPWPAPVATKRRRHRTSNILRRESGQRARWEARQCKNPKMASASSVLVRNWPWTGTRQPNTLDLWRARPPQAESVRSVKSSCTSSRELVNAAADSRATHARPKGDETKLNGRGLPDPSDFIRIGKLPFPRSHTCLALSTSPQSLTLAHVDISPTRYTTAKHRQTGKNAFWQNFSTFRLPRPSAAFW